MVAEDLSSLARKYYVKKNFTRALFYLQKANRVQPRDTNVLLGMANCYMQLGDQGNGIKTIKKILKIDPENDKLYFHLS